MSSNDGEYEITHNGKVCNVSIEGSESGNPRVSMRGDFEACEKAKSLIHNGAPLPGKK
ncbi:Uncharacterised protein [uncultured archaeon]|nr:Uncharacterised protein [uncultured archaeon]